MKGHAVKLNDQQNTDSTVADLESVSGKFFAAGIHMEYTGPAAPKDFVLPEGMEMIPWQHSRFFWLKHNGILVAGPARREVLESFLHVLCTNPEKEKGLAALRWTMASDDGEGDGEEIGGRNPRPRAPRFLKTSRIVTTFSRSPMPSRNKGFLNI